MVQLLLVVGVMAVRGKMPWKNPISGTHFSVNAVLFESMWYMFVL